MPKKRWLRVAAAAALGIALAGCGAQTSAPKPSKQTAHQVKSSGKKTSSGSSSSSSSSTGSGSSGAGSSSGSSSATGPKVLYSLAPGSQTSAGAMALLSVRGLPQGWTLEELQAWSSAGEMCSEAPTEATTSVFSPTQGGFSMGSDGQVISYFFPTPPGKWAGTSVYFTFVYKTSSGATQSVSSGSFTFPKE